MRFQNAWGFQRNKRKRETPARQRVAGTGLWWPSPVGRFVGNLDSYFCMDGGTTYVFVYFPGYSNIRRVFLYHRVYIRFVAFFFKPQFFLQALTILLDPSYTRPGEGEKFPWNVNGTA